MWSVKVRLAGEPVPSVYHVTVLRNYFTPRDLVTSLHHSPLANSVIAEGETVMERRVYHGGNGAPSVLRSDHRELVCRID